MNADPMNEWHITLFSLVYFALFWVNVRNIALAWVVMRNLTMGQVELWARFLVTIAILGDNYKLENLIDSFFNKCTRDFESFLTTTGGTF